MAGRYTSGYQQMDLGKYYDYSGPGALYYSLAAAELGALANAGAQGAMTAVLNSQTGQIGVEEWGGNVYEDANGVYSYTSPVQGPFCPMGANSCKIETATSQFQMEP